MKKYKIGLLIGRFQPFHSGHLWLIKRALQSINRLKIGIGSANVKDIDNFLTYDQRKKILETVIKKENLQEKILKIIPLDDYPDDNVWFKKTIEAVGDFNVVVGNNDWVNDIFEKKGYEILKTGYYKRYLYEGVKIRKLIKEGKNWQDRLPDYLISNFKFVISKQFFNLQKPVFKFSHIILGGTFDHLHKGYKLLIDKAFKLGEQVTIGLTTKKLIKNKFLPQTIESYKERKQALINYLISKNYNGRFKICQLNNIFGPSLTDKKFGAIIVSFNTYPNALKINQIRRENKLKPLKIITVKNVIAEDGKLLSSERIRAGEIDREGKSYWLLVNS
ncbi:MAG: pantetheine-phosphate adenylyltransferase, partial [Candidatus Pacearchaeota archaeon]